MNPMSQISPVTDAEAARLVQSGTLVKLVDEITSTDPAPAGGRGRSTHDSRRRSPLRKRLLIAVPLAAGLAVAALVATSIAGPSQRVGPITIGPAKAQAAVLSFTRHGHYIDVIVRNPVADPRRYRAEFARYHLNIGLTLVPASPSIVGTLVAESESANAGNQIEPITAVGRCFTGGGGNVCPVGVRVPVNFHGSATLVFGRAAWPGEQYESAGVATAPGEAMHGLNFVGKKASVVLAMLAKRHVTVPQWRAQRSGQCYTMSLRTVPGNWFVYDAVPWAPGQVLLWASKTWPVSASCAPVPASPQPSPTASAPSPAG